MPNRDLTQMRQSYEFAHLIEAECEVNPFLQFEKWFNYAINSNIIEPNAMQIATVGKDLQPSLRTVLLKSFNENGFVFYTNYESKKGNQLQENQKIALLFWFRELEQQIRIEGIATKTTLAENEIYFHSRPKDSQLAATISAQSTIIKSRTILENLFEEKKIAFENKEIPLRENWGGYRVVPTLFEFWQGRKNRLHDRIQYTKEAEKWIMNRLAP